MKQERNIRRATAADSDDLKSCMLAAYAGYQDRMGGLPLPPMQADYRSEIENYPVWVVEAQGTILGALIMTFDNAKANIANIAVKPEFQNQGIGGDLMHFADEQARLENYNEIHLATHVLLTENITLYQHLGWIETGRDEVRVFMKKQIG